MQILTQAEALIWLTTFLLKEQGKPLLSLSDSFTDNFELFRALCNVREPNSISEEYLKIQDHFLTTLNQQRGITDVATLKPSPQNEKIFIWRGDITKLNAAAIVNAANNQLLGCFIPLHTCIDNTIHTYAGIQLRLYCHQLMQAQGHPEATGLAKISPAFNLPSSFVIHTVGPIVNTAQASADDEASLASSYLNCLKLAEAEKLESIAFCCISTGVFHFPNQRAAEIAIQTVQNYLPQCQHIRKVIFNVYQENDEYLYRQLLF